MTQTHTQGVLWIAELGEPERTQRRRTEVADDADAPVHRCRILGDFN